MLAGRKNTGIIKGDIFVNGKVKDERQFRRMMGYVEQFDTLSPRDTVREAVEFAAGLRLPRDTSPDVMAAWVSQVISMLELEPLQNTLVGSVDSGGMSFEQKKRLSIAVELVANPAILFLDEPVGVPRLWLLFKLVTYALIAAMPYRPLFRRRVLILELHK